MNRLFIRYLFTAMALVALGKPSRAADFYIAQTATGDASGRDINNCKPYSFFTTASNWGGATGTTICAAATKNTTRDVIHLVGTITGQLAWPDAYPYDTSTGSAGLSIVFEPNAKLSAPAWPKGAIYWESSKYVQKHRVTIDGGVNGLIECTDNGTNKANQLDSSGITFLSASYVTIKNLTISNIFVRVYGTTEPAGGAGINASTASGPFTDLTVQNCTIHDVNIGINAGYTNGSARYSFFGNHIYNVNWGIGSGSTTLDASMDDWIADGNNIHDFANWDQPTGDAFHHNGIFLWGSNGTNAFRSWRISNNTFGPNFGTRATGGVYLSSYGMIGTGLVYNNVFIGSTSNGLLTIGTGTGSVVRVFNNTFIGNGGTNINIGGSSASAMTIDIQNNISTGGIFINGNYVSSVTLKSDRNIIFGFPTTFPGAISWSTSANGSAIKWSDWVSTYGHDVNSLYNVDPLLDSSYRPRTGSPAIGRGSDQSLYFTTYKDSASIRTVPWNLGAYAPVSSDVSPLLAPSNARVSAQ
jgi:hypothetical protein